MRATDYKDPPKVAIELEQVGQLEGTYESTGRVYSSDGLCPTIYTMGGGSREPKIAEPILVGGVGEINFGKQYRQGNRIYDSEGVAMALMAQPVGNAGENSYLYKVSEPTIARMTGRNPDNPKSRKSGLPTEQMLEPRLDDNCGALTTVQKDNLVIEPSGIYIGDSPAFHHGPLEGISRTLKAEKFDAGVYEGFRVRKLTPKECWRLMGFRDDDFDKAKTALNKTFYKGADRSNSQLYKQAGNSIVTNVLSAIFGEMIG